MPIFNNWDSVVESWYCLTSVKKLNQKKILNVQIGQQKLVLFLTEKGKIHCLDAFCSHMGLNLVTGAVVKEQLRCQFHHWSFDSEGVAANPTCQKKLSDKFNLTSYPIEIRYGLIWLWPAKKFDYPLPFHPDLPEGSFDYLIGSSYARPSHPHISLLNALDVQHVNTVHALDLKIASFSSESEDKTTMHYEFKGRFINDSLKGKLVNLLTGGQYNYSVTYVAGTIGFLKALHGIKLLGLFKLRPMYATFSYRPENGLKTIIQPIFLTPKKPGLLGFLTSTFYLWMSAIMYHRIKNEDGVIYENIRFTPHFETGDENIVKYIAHINRLKKSTF
jgi:nitrite reductase/ring-hydroxylating ferredoxin subunit